MVEAALPAVGAWEAWRARARDLAGRRIAPEAIRWRCGGDPAGLALGARPPAGPRRELTVPSGFLELGRLVALHRDPERFGALYLALWRLQETPRLLADAADPLVGRLRRMASAVRRDAHKMKAFVRFRELPAEAAARPGRRRFAAWFEPDHHVLEHVAPFFARRFADMDWAVATPELTAAFVDGALGFAPTVERPPQGEDATGPLWDTYYAHIFNPARLKLDAMRSEMPTKYWRNLPETRAIPGLVAGARARTAAMRAAAPTAPAPGAGRILRTLAADQAEPPAEGLAALAAAARACTRCPLHAPATQTVFGEGPAEAALMFVGEQPGDMEDLAGRPFVGPAGGVFDAALRTAGIDRDAVYVTNAVKHFKFEPRGRRRLHKRPETPEIEHCRWWLTREIGAVGPRLLVALGATAAQALTGRGDAVLRRRGAAEPGLDGRPVFLTVHPAHLLRIPDAPARASATAAFAADLAEAARLAAGPPPGAGAAGRTGVG